MNLDSIIDTTISRGDGPGILHQQNDFGGIKAEESAILEALRGRSGVWDAAEYGISAERAAQMIADADTPEARADVIAQLKERALRRANLASTDEKIHLVSALEVPWHGLGTVTDRLLRGREAMSLSALNGWDIKKVQQYVDWNGERVATDRWALMRGDTGQFLASVGSDYEVYQTEEAVDFLESLVNGEAAFETAGAIGFGATIWFLVQYPELSRAIAGSDEVKSYVAMTLSHGYTANRLLPTNVRCCCANTYRQGMNEGKGKGYSFSHRKNIRQAMERAREDLRRARYDCVEFLDSAEHLATKRLPNDLAFFHACLDDVVDVTIAGQKLSGGAKSQHKNVLDAILDIEDVDRRAVEEKRYDRAIRRRAAFLDDILERYESERCNGNEDISGSAWSAVNAVTECYQHSENFRYRGSKEKRSESRFNAIMEGRVAVASDQALSRAIQLTA